MQWPVLVQEVVNARLADKEIKAVMELFQNSGLHIDAYLQTGTGIGRSRVNSHAALLVWALKFNLQETFKFLLSDKMVNVWGY
jgi:hypothetical protein